MKHKKRANIVIAALIVVILVKIAMLAAEQKPKEELGTAVKLNLDGDFPNTQEGTAVFNMRLLMDRIIAVNNKVPKYVIFTESNAIPGLMLRYNVHDSVFEGGLPLIRSNEVTFLDGNIHEVIYTFKKGAEQKFFFDGAEIASGIFDDSKIGITGFAVNELVGYESTLISFEGTAEMLDKAR